MSAEIKKFEKMEPETKPLTPAEAHAIRSAHAQKVELERDPVIGRYLAVCEAYQNAMQIVAERCGWPHITITLTDQGGSASPASEG